MAGIFSILGWSSLDLNLFETKTSLNVSDCDFHGLKAALFSQIAQPMNISIQALCFQNVSFYEKAINLTVLNATIDIVLTSGGQLYQYDLQGRFTNSGVNLGVSFPINIPTKATRILVPESLLTNTLNNWRSEYFFHDVNIQQQVLTAIATISNSIKSSCLHLRPLLVQLHQPQWLGLVDSYDTNLLPGLNSICVSAIELSSNASLSDTRIIGLSTSNFPFNQLITLANTKMELSLQWQGTVSQVISGRISGIFQLGILSMFTSFSLNEGINVIKISPPAIGVNGKGQFQSFNDPKVALQQSNSLSNKLQTHLDFTVSNILEKFPIDGISSKDLAAINTANIPSLQNAAMGSLVAMFTQIPSNISTRVYKTIAAKSFEPGDIKGYL